MQKDKALNNVSFSTKAFERYPDLKNKKKGLKKAQNGPKKAKNLKVRKQN